MPDPGAATREAGAPADAVDRWYRSPLAKKQATHGIYVEILVLALILALEGKGASGGGVLVPIVGAVVAVLLAEVYSFYVGTMISDGRRPSSDELRAVALGAAGGMLATVPPILLLVLGATGLISIDDGFRAAKWVGVSLIGLFALAANRRAGLSRTRSVVGALALFGIAIALVLLKQAVH